ncbi:hypothetical protein J5J83_02685 [Azoarcus sp. L1K30]|uniref:hypothetical protein n=1 Tax=Azoarcus sp. L1K30 TaxID=2820277 RepID=UPI001B816217|nr:hypothetical protein [Azoarcus sp. L1K30]MBR0565022.1 hypothetical protein [Azoarcus sp. L1K30]
MPELASHTDKHGHAVAIGDEVRILSIRMDPDIDDDEREMFEFMRGSICEIERFDAEGRAWVSMWWSTGEGNATTSVGLAPNEMERVTSHLPPQAPVR